GAPEPSTPFQSIWPPLGRLDPAAAVLRPGRRPARIESESGHARPPVTHACRSSDRASGRCVGSFMLSRLTALSLASSLLLAPLATAQPMVQPRPIPA